MSNQLVLYHGPGCADGFTAAYVAWTVYDDAAEYVEVQYGQPPPDVAGKDVLIVDFSYPRAVLLEMAAKAKSIRVLDHHKSAAKDLEGLDFCTFDMGRSGAQIAWDVLHGGDREPLVDYTADRDLWKWALADSRAINAWIGVQERTFARWDAMAKELWSEPDVCALAGHAILKHIDAYVESTAKNARHYRIAGHVVPVVNAPGMMGSELIGKLAESAAFAVGWFQRADGIYQYSLRSRGDFDVSKIAEKFGGGGHFHSAGFERAYDPAEEFDPPGLITEAPDAV